ncbi:hypothetical protein V6N11_019322 [Hibiscus sabdariffa]|uniref:Uncharacterized protein n=1 Tax=Hibiscus sabdariffa TaxID=183260 RepID=A0ABR2R292_9ROSI
MVVGESNNTGVPINTTDFIQPYGNPINSVNPANHVNTTESTQLPANHVGSTLNLLPATRSSQVDRGQSVGYSVPPTAHVSQVYMLAYPTYASQPQQQAQVHQQQQTLQVLPTQVPPGFSFQSVPPVSSPMMFRPASPFTNGVSPSNTSSQAFMATLVPASAFIATPEVVDDNACHHSLNLHYSHLHYHLYHLHH